ncbi:integrase core domain-containing protein, partial [Bifidobacterium mongoliense]|uniref:integrase core domain-containing protein n=1 Tax=Bifidobacterium mongoliense TaxID=518643 RepID=UPI0030EF7B79
TRYTGCPYGIHVKEAGIIASTGTVGDSRDNALAETVNGVCRTESVRRYGPFESVHTLERATFEWVSWWNDQRLQGHPGYRTPAEVEALYHQHQAISIAPKTNKTM